MILNKKDIELRLSHNPPMVSNLINKDIQLQPTGLDLTVKNISKWTSAGHLDFDNSKSISPLDNERGMSRKGHGQQVDKEA